MYVQHMCAWYLWRSEEGIGFFRIVVTDGCKRPCGLWEPNLGTLKEQQVILTTEPSLYAQDDFS